MQPQQMSRRANSRRQRLRLQWRRVLFVELFGAEQMKPSKCRSVLIAVASLLLMSACRADEIVVAISSATAGHDKRTGKPLLNLSVTEASQERLRSFGADNLGKMVEFRADGRVVLRTLIRTPLSVRFLQINDPSWTDQAVIELARQFSEAPRGEIELRPSSPSN